jgi:hypothetical protein
MHGDRNRALVAEVDHEGLPLACLKGRAVISSVLVGMMSQGVGSAWIQYSRLVPEVENLVSLGLSRAAATFGGTGTPPASFFMFACRSMRTS